MKKILYGALCCLMILTLFTACNRNTGSNSSGMNSGSVSSSGTVSSEISSEVSSEIRSEVSSENSSSASSDIGNTSQNNTANNNSASSTGFLLNDFSKAYKDAGFDVTDSTYGDGLNSIRVKLKDAVDDIYYEIISFGSADEAKAEMDKVNEKGEKKAYVNGNALVIGEKDYESHDKYMEPFNNLK